MTKLSIPLFISLCVVGLQCAVLGVPLPVVGSISLAMLLITLSVFDLRDMRLPDALTFGLAVAGLVLMVFNWPALMWSHILAALVWGLGLWALSEVCFRMLGRDVLGLGDVKLIAASALWVGPFIAQAIIIASIGALIFGVFKGLWGTARLFSFGPFICAGVWIVWSWSGFGPLGI